MASQKFFVLTPVAACIAASSVFAQSTLAPVTVTGRASPVVNVGGFGDVPLSKLPLQGNSFSSTLLQDMGATSLADVTRLDASVSDSYNANGYWQFLSVRGFTLDNRYNFRRDGLPINAETSIGLENKQTIELLKGTSGMQAGTSSPGGLVNFVVKRPDAPVRGASVELRSDSTYGAAVDLGDRFGVDGTFGLRLNAAAEHLDPPLRASEGNRHLGALAGDWRIGPSTLLEAEVETSHQSQPSQPGFSMRGGAVPPPNDPRINLNNQPWSEPVVLDGNTASLRLRQQLAEAWRFTAHLATQHLHMDDRLAFPFGCSAENVFDRYCSNGSFDFYQYKSDGEKRRTNALDLSIDGKLATGSLLHTLTAGVLFTRFESRMNFRPDDGIPVGVGQDDGSVIVDPLPALPLTPGTNRTERSNELYVRDTIALTDSTDAWVGLRHTRLHRESVRTDGSRATNFSQSLTTPWVALSHRLNQQHMVYGSWGEGMESDVAPNRAQYSNAGETLPALKSKQVEIGIKADADALDWQVALFRITRPQAGNVGTRWDIDGSARHQGVEASAQWQSGAWLLAASGMWLDAEREGSANSAVNGKRPPNVPEHTLKLQAGYRVAALPGLRLLAGVVHEGDRTLLPDDESARIPSWTRLDLGLVHQHSVGAGTTLTWRAGIDNVTDKRAWRESPYQFGHVYLYPLAPRTFRLSVEASL